MKDPDHIVVVGASAAGITAVRTLRAQNWAGKITIVGKEICLPYDRPPLSKRLMSGSCEPQALNLATRNDMEALDVRYLSGNPAASLCPEENLVTLGDGTRLHYDRLLVATGADARTVPILKYAANCYSLRTLDDALAIRMRLQAGKRLLIVGAGFIGTELAAVARARDIDVTVIDKGETPLGARVGDLVGKKIEALHEANGVTFQSKCEIIETRWIGNSIVEVRLDNGICISCDLIVVAVGATPNVEWCRDSEMPVRSGLLCDEFCEARNNVFAAGDVAEWFHRGYGEHVRIEHRTNASEQAMVAAKNMLGARIEYTPLPFFWSDQYQVQIHSYGRTSAKYSTAVLSSDDKNDSCIFGYFQGEVLVGVLSWNAGRKAREYIQPLKHGWLESTARAGETR